MGVGVVPTRARVDALVAVAADGAGVGVCAAEPEEDAEAGDVTRWLANRGSRATPRPDVDMGGTSLSLSLSLSLPLSPLRSDERWPTPWPFGEVVAPGEVDRPLADTDPGLPKRPREGEVTGVPRGEGGLMRLMPLSLVRRCRWEKMVDGWTGFPCFVARHDRQGE